MTRITPTKSYYTVERRTVAAVCVMRKETSKLGISSKQTDVVSNITATTATSIQIKNVSNSSADMDALIKNENVSRLVRSHVIENFVVVWLDSNINSDNDIRNSIIQLQYIVYSVKTFTNADECVDFLTDINDGKFFMIISDSFAQHLIPLLKEITRLHSIYVFCSDKSIHKRWTNKCEKVKGVFSQIEPLCDVLKGAIRQFENDLTPISIVTSSSVTGLDELDQSFMYSQLLKDIILNITYEGNSKKEFIDFCRVQYTDNDVQLNAIDSFERDIELHSPIWWYTKEPFIYSTLNKALRTQDLEIIIKMGFFVQHLHRQIDQLHSEPHEPTKMIIYRGQGVSNVDFEKIKKGQGGLFSFANFLSTSADRELSLLFADSARGNPDLTGILFHLEIDPSISSVPFASLDHISYYSDSEKEILFSMHTVFRIGEMKQIEDRLWEVNLTLTSDNDQQLKNLTDHIREEIGSGTGWHRMGTLMLMMGEFKKAIEIYNTLPEITSDSDQKESDIMLWVTNNNIGEAHREMGDYSTALLYYEKTLEIQKKSLSCNHPNLAITYSNIGLVHYSMEAYSTALSYYEKALEIQKKSFLPNHPEMANIYNNIGGAHLSMKDHSIALSYFEKALEIRLKSLPSNHPELAITINNIANVHQSMGSYSTALLYFEKALKIYLKSLPPYHTELIKIYSNIGVVYFLMKDYPTALPYFEKTLEIYQKSLPANHPELANVYHIIGMVHRDMGDLSTAVSYFKKTLEIQQKSLPHNHPDLAGTCNAIALAYQSMGDHSNALRYHEAALETQQKCLPPNHPALLNTYINIGIISYSMEDYLISLLYFEKTLEMQQKSLPSNHPVLAMTYHGIGKAHKSMRDYSTALLFYERALEIQQKALLPNHPDLFGAHLSMAMVLDGLHRYKEAVEHATQAADIAYYTFGLDHPKTKIIQKYLDQLRPKL